MKILITAVLLSLFYTQVTLQGFKHGPHTVQDVKIYGVNLGGWLLLEPFITPSVFKAIEHIPVKDEWVLTEYLKQTDPVLLNETLTRHYDTFLQETDIQLLKSVGITHVRIPVGYWSMMTQEELDVAGEPYRSGAWPYLVRGISWLKKYNIKAIVDLHGAPGSQNGFDNSGRTGETKWGTGNTVERTLGVLDRLAYGVQQLENDAATSETVIGVELLNEPWPWRINGTFATLIDYYERGYRVVRRYLPADRYWVVIPDGFSASSFNGYFQPPEFQNMWMDVHNYHCFDEYLRNLSYEEHLQLTCTIQYNQVRNVTLPAFAGEWSVAYKVESLHAHTEPYPNEVEQEFMKKHALTQMQIYETNPPGHGWMFWNFKTESAPMWDFFAGIRGGWLPCSYPSAEPIQQACSLFHEQKQSTTVTECHIGVVVTNVSETINVSTQLPTALVQLSETSKIPAEETTVQFAVAQATEVFTVAESEEKAATKVAAIPVVPQETHKMKPEDKLEEETCPEIVEPPMDAAPSLSVHCALFVSVLYLLFN